jgi:peptidoglycan/xylan/chitin deacetylase (PgdA/CDA1 family)
MPNQIELNNGIFMISIDTEFAWGFIDKLNTDLARKYIYICAKRSRRNILKILQISEELNVPITFGFVGKLLLQDSKTHNSVWNAKDIFLQIFNSRVEHEIACHSFSHIEFTKCSREEAQYDIRMCKKVMRDLGVDPVSFLYPRNRIGYIDILKNEGFKTFRYRLKYKYSHDTLLDIFVQSYGLPKNVNSLIAIPANILFQSPSNVTNTVLWLTSLKALKEIAVNRRIFHIMLHDYIESDITILYLKYILKYAKKMEKKGLIKIKTMRDIYEELKNA